MLSGTFTLELRESYGSYGDAISIDELSERARRRKRLEENRAIDMASPQLI